MIYMFLAEGFEEIEALGTLDILRRANLDVKTVGVGGKTIMGAHSISVEADMVIDSVAKEDCEGVILPGGLPGTTNLEANEKVIDFVKYSAAKNILLAAICAAPSILGHLGILEGKKATAYPGYENDLVGAQYTGDYAVCDGNIVTGKGAGAVFEFGLLIVEKLVSSDVANKLRSQMQCTV